MLRLLPQGDVQQAAETVKEVVTPLRQLLASRTLAIKPQHIGQTMIEVVNPQDIRRRILIGRLLPVEQRRELRLQLDDVQGQQPKRIFEDVTSL